MELIGRRQEQRLLADCLASKKPEFLAVYGRRRVGKTFLIRQFCHDRFAFHLTGSSGGDLAGQLDIFVRAARQHGWTTGRVRSWMDAFDELIALLERTKVRYQGRRIVFLDEIAWLDTRRSGFLRALEHFWNTWGSAQADLVLIICGSASSWIINKVLKNRGGLHNRVTRRMRLEPFSLAECEEFLHGRRLGYTRQDVADAYLTFGGIPFYLDQFRRGLSVAQNVDELCFADTAPLADEFEEMLHSLFEHAGHHVDVLRLLATKRRGLTRDEIIRAGVLSSGGGLTQVLADLEQSGFVFKYMDFATVQGRSVYQLVDPFVSFYLSFMTGRRRDAHYWASRRGTGAYNAWKGYAFEMACLLHVPQLKDGLGISGVSTTVSSWRQPGGHLQIDLVIDRADGVIDLCEMKYSTQPYVVTKDYAARLDAKRAAFQEATGTKQALHTVLVTPRGIKTNSHSHAAHAVLTLDDLWRDRDR
jgi:hypothetical protein